MQERAKNQHYSEQRGHWQRGASHRFKMMFGYRPSTLAGDPVFLRQIVQDRRRLMRRIPRDGRV